MAIKLISYDLGGPETSESYKKLIDRIKSLGESPDDAIKPLESFWLVDTDLPSSVIYGQLKVYLDPNDSILINDFPRNWIGCLSLQTIDWLNRH